MTEAKRETLRMSGVQSPLIPIVGEMIRAYPGTVSLGQGVVSYGPPPEALDRLPGFLANPHHHRYQAVDGLPPLREAIAEKLRAENGVAVGDGDARVVVTAGGNMAFMNALLAITDPGDEIILPAPFYFNHEMAIALADCRAVPVPTDENYQPRPADIRRAISRRTRAVVTVSPNNPTGAVYAAETLREINAICREQGLYHLSDEAYEYFTYGTARHFSPASIAASAPYTISLFSLSKAYGFASWRIGYMVIPAHLYTSICKIQDTILICPPVVSQAAALGALGAGVAYCREKIAPLAEIREIALHELDRVRTLVTVPRAEGAFYLFLRVETRMPTMELVERLIAEHGVAVMPGTTFGAHDGCYLRVAYGALDKETAAAGLGRLVRGLQTIFRA